MFDSVQILSNVISVNLFDIIETANIREGSYPVPFYVRLWQSDRKVRYVPAAGATIQIEFMRSDVVGEHNTSQTVTKTLLQPFALTDTSIWFVELTESDVSKIVTGGFRVTLIEGGQKTVLYSKMSVVKSPSSSDCGCY